MTLQQTFELAVRHHQAGRTAEAEPLYRQVLARQPKHAETLHLLGILVCQTGRNQNGVELIRRAVANRPSWPEAQSNLGNALLATGRPEEAIAAYREAIRLNPNSPQTLSNLGIALAAAGQLDDAVAVYRKAIAIKPGNPEAFSNLGNALKEQGKLDEAIAAFEQALILRPSYADGHNNLGIALHAKGQLEKAIAEFRQAIALRPDFPQAHNNLGNALRDQGQLDEAMAAYHRAIAIKPDYPEPHCNLGNVLKDRGQLDEAIAAFRRAVALYPAYADAHTNLGNALSAQGFLDDAIAAYCQVIALRPTAEAHSNLGNALHEKGQLDEAVAAFQQAIALKPTYAEAYSNLGNSLVRRGQLDQAVDACRQAIALKPDLSGAYSNLGNALKDRGDIDDAIAAYRSGVAAAPGDPIPHDNLVFSMHYHPGYDARAMAEAHRQWHEAHGRPLIKFIRPHTNNRDANRRLRIGYVSSDLREHPVARFLLPLLAHHNKAEVEVFAYSQTAVVDAMTERLRLHIDGWRTITGLSDSQVADMIRQDQIDILVDLAMHSAGNRLPVFARKPAPLQVTYLAYCSGTGLETIDYRLSDPYLDPVEMDESIYCERTIRLQSYWCYQPTISQQAISVLPAPKRGFVTFGSFNNFCKVSEPTLVVWATVLREISNSQLVVHAHEGSHRQRVFDLLKREGVEPARVRFVGKMPAAEYFRLYHEIDIALDPFPYGGGTTTCDALWVGVPVVSLVGNTAVGRGGLSILSNVGLPELCGDSPEQYVQIAKELAGDLPRLSMLRSTLRQRMEHSPLMDAAGFAKNVESAFRQIWRTWCSTNGETRPRTS
jgi:predicted O-linked N-acetylglucosamine transferase (SPINDLY family)